MIDSEKITSVIELIFRFGGIGGDHHKAWVIDQVLRIVAGDKYDSLVEEMEGDPADGDYYYGEWQVGIPP